MNTVVELVETTAEHGGFMDWFESENFWTQFAPIMFDDARWAEAPTVAEYVKDLASLGHGSKVLDAGCGLGRRVENMCGC